MKKLVAIFLVAILAGYVTIPNAFSDDGKNNGPNDSENQDGINNQKSDANSHENANHDNDTKENDKIQFGFSNATSVNLTLPNGTQVTFAFSNGTNIGKQLASFIHQLRDSFTQEGNLSKQVIKDCRQQAKNASPSERKIIMDQCKTKLQEIKNQFHLEQKQFQVDLKQLRELVTDKNQVNHENHEKPQVPNHVQNQTHTPKQNGPEQVLKHQKGKNRGHGKQD